MLDQRLEEIGFKDTGAVAVDHGRDALEAHPGIDSFALQRSPLARLVAIPLHEDQVPDLEEAVAVLAVWAAVGPATAVFLTPVVMDLGVRTTRSGRASGPEVVVVAKTPDPRFGNPRLLPDFETLVVVVVDARPEPLLVKVQLLGQELVGVGNRLLLEVVAEGEIPQHLEEGQMVTVLADDIDIDGTKNLLTSGCPREGRLSLAEKVGLERDHPRTGEQQGRIAERDQGGAR